MNANDFVYQAVYKRCLELKIRDGVSANYASLALDKFKKNNYTGKVSKLINDMVLQAKKASKR